uniref:Estradiol 17-beta-dehydrogenase 12 n=1 Tax=Strongyloides stercoralis TaxID=6248 RepID=A0A0K0E411_STRER
MVCSDVINLLGYGVLLYFGVKLFCIVKRIFYPYVIATPIDLKKVSGSDWAAITGSTDGIGKQYAIELSKKGFNIILISRNPSKLEDVKNEIHKISPNVEVETITFDFKNTTLDDYEDILIKELRKYEIGIFINNVGLFSEYPDILHKTEGGLKRISDQIIVNTLPVTILTAGVIPQMLERNKGIIINVSSFAGYGRMAEFNVYSASKRYVIHLTRILQKEYSNTGIIFQCICPLLVITNMSKAEKTNIFAPYPNAFVKSALRTIGHTNETSGYLTHQLQTEGANLLPTFIMDIFLKINNEQMRGYMKNKSIE